MIPLHFFAEIINSSFGQSWLAADVCENCTQSVPSKQPATASQHQQPNKQQPNGGEGKRAGNRQIT